MSNKPPSSLNIVKTKLVRGVRAINGLFSSDSSKSTKFGPEVHNAVGFTSLPAKTVVFRLDVNHRYKT